MSGLRSGSWRQIDSKGSSLHSPTITSIPFFSEASSSSSVVDQTLKRIRGFQLGRNKSPSKGGSEGPSRDGLRRESPSLLDKFKSALHIDGGEGRMRGRRGGISNSSPSC